MSVQVKKVAGWSAVLLFSMTAVILVAQWMRTIPEVAIFISNYRGSTPLPEGAPVGFPAWLGWQHFLNFFFLLFVIRTGWIIRSKKRPPAFWTPTKFRLNKNTPAQRMGLYHWFHIQMDFLWVLNGVIFIVMLFVTGQWMRIVPTSWDVFPNAASAALQYASLRWPLENAWVNYNSLQVLAYFVTVFIAAPIAIKTGLRLSPLWPKQGWLHRIFPENVARKLHVIVLFYFFIFIVAHVTLVFTTGALRNLNMMFAANDRTSWLGAGMFGLSVVVMVAGWFLMRPSILKPLAAFSGKVQG
ncbi:cytochrome b/b6 domain-containing protein [Aurantimicrobium minutum]|uniref:cytochrome b/b6 domain-containing protein n=1 Tax=Aurantimicrobium minutum TaxID=708131 RepID=UPI0024746A5B|nr:cytochrome b/b6 domain-containing protein [Aurantimicrobium minutum]MDH6423607.1 thiosulfate reductase cytochrome b subunit [Aurantimicrobium minutum]